MSELKAQDASTTQYLESSPYVTPPVLISFPVRGVQAPAVTKCPRFIIETSDAEIYLNQMSSMLLTCCGL